MSYVAIKIWMPCDWSEKVVLVTIWEMLQIKDSKFRM